MQDSQDWNKSTSLAPTPLSDASDPRADVSLGQPALEAAASLSTMGNDKSEVAPRPG